MGWPNISCDHGISSHGNQAATKGNDRRVCKGWPSSAGITRVLNRTEVAECSEIKQTAHGGSVTTFRANENELFSASELLNTIPSLLSMPWRARLSKFGVGQRSTGSTKSTRPRLEHAAPQNPGLQRPILLLFLTLLTHAMTEDPQELWTRHAPSKAPPMTLLKRAPIEFCALLSIIEIPPAGLLSHPITQPCDLSRGDSASLSYSEIEERSTRDVGGRSRRRTTVSYQFRSSTHRKLEIHLVSK